MAGTRRTAATGIALVLAAAVASCSSSSNASNAQGSAAPGGTASPGSEAAGFQDTLVKIVEKVDASVVEVRTATGVGSGVVFDSNGDIVTNAHVVGTATALKIASQSGIIGNATLVGAFSPDDLAVVRMSGGGAQLPPATFADSSKLRVGDIVLAIGNPLGLTSSVTEGIVSATGRTISEGNNIVIPDAVQTSASINPGNSGGALVDLSGEVVGIPTLAAIVPELGGSAAPGIGFAIPSNIARDIATQIITSGKVTNSHRAYIGLGQVASVVDSSGRAAGCLVGGVVAGGPADKAGLQAGDIIVSIGGTATPTAERLAAALATLEPGQTVDVDFVRGGQTRHTPLTLGEYPGS